MRASSISDRPSTCGEVVAQGVQEWFWWEGEARQDGKAGREADLRGNWAVLVFGRGRECHGRCYTVSAMKAGWG
jgi:hypothetical protein